MAASWASSPAVRRSMLGNRSRDTSPELALRRELRRLGLPGYRVDCPAAYGRADVAFVGRRLAVFVDGCFWHGCPLHWEPPRRNRAYWLAKVDRNRARDRGVDEVLRLRGWAVVRAWEHEDPAAVALRVWDALGRPPLRPRPPPRRPASRRAGRSRA